MNTSAKQSREAIRNLQYKFVLNDMDNNLKEKAASFEMKLLSLLREKGGRTPT